MTCRARDPETSRDAADAVCPSFRRRVCRQLHGALAAHGPACDQRMIDLFSRAGLNLSPSTVRGARKRLQLDGLVRQTGRKVRTRYHRWAFEWEVLRTTTPSREGR